jgi:hypothetical protein
MKISIFWSGREANSRAKRILSVRFSQTKLSVFLGKWRFLAWAIKIYDFACHRKTRGDEEERFVHKAQ